MPQGSAVGSGGVRGLVYFIWLSSASSSRRQMASSRSPSDKAVSQGLSVAPFFAPAYWKALLTRMAPFCFTGVTRPRGSYSPETWLRSSHPVSGFGTCDLTSSSRRSLPYLIFCSFFEKFTSTITWSLSSSGMEPRPKALLSSSVS